MNLEGTACCAHESGRVCQPTYKEGADKWPKGWKGKVPEGATYKQARGGGGADDGGSGGDDNGARRRGGGGGTFTVDGEEFEFVFEE